DLAVVNGEGVISSGGSFADKNETMPYMYRAHPNMVEVLTNAGIDVVAVGNNHVGDYGREAFGEMLDRLSTAGIAYSGGGHNLDDARRPAYRTVGDTVVAIVGGDLTMTETARATTDSPGTLFFREAHLGKDEDRIVGELTKILKEARKHAHVVLFTPHWGRNYKTKPTRGLRSLAKRLIKAGYDAIMGHSAHWFHGVELIDGKPVMYDAGNLLLDYNGGDRGDESHRNILWELTVSRAGVTGIKGHPLFLRKNHSTLAKGTVRDEILETLEKRSKRLGTDLAIENGVAVLECDPGSISGPKGRPSPPVRPVPKEIRKAPNDAIIDEVPAGVNRVNIEYSEGIRLVGYKLLLDELTIPFSGQVVALYWTTDRKVNKSYHIHLEARGRHPGTEKPKKGYAGHLPGDWVLPTDEWPVG
ncbi:MAG: CapA family protein, partial [Deltaproteobacteria bacterium]|nr:CapA family protein [Deltaproteobacteria bacterium]